MSAFLLVVTLALAAQAARDPRDYRESLNERTARRAERLVFEGKAEEAIAVCRGHVRALGPSVEVVYEWAVAHNALGELKPARQRLDEVLAMDEAHAAARYDRAELRLLEGDLAGAGEDLAVARRVRPDHWAVHFRLAELAALQGDPGAFEVALLDAVRYGFELRSLPEYPRWRTFLADPTIGPVLQRLVVVYGDDRILDALRGP